MQAVKKYILKGAEFFIIGGFIILAAMIFLNGIFAQYDRKDTIHILLLTVCMITLFALLRGLYKEPFKNQIAKNRILFAVLWGVLIILQALFLFSSRNLLRYDALNVYDEAVSIFYDGGISGITKNGYFSHYVNNHPITLITFLFLKIGKILHLTDPDFGNGIFYLQWINLAAVDISLFMGFLFIRDYFEDGSLSLFYMLFLLLSPLTYVWIPFYYTNTLSMPFYMTGLWLFCRVLGFKRKSDNGVKSRRRAIYALAAGCFFYIGFAIRATVIITIIAVVMTMFFANAHKKEWASLLLLLMGAVVGICCIKPLGHKYITFDYTDTAFPALHWIMMGAKGEGTYNMRDEEFTAYFETKEDKYNADKILLTQRLEELGMTGTFRHMFHKLFLTFGDGTGDYAHELSISESYGTLYRYVFGDRRAGLQIYAQAVYLTALFYAVIAAAGILKKGFQPLFVIFLNLLGAFLFYMLWEAGTVYSIGFLPLFYIGATGGMEFAGLSRFRIPSDKIKPLCTIAMILAVLAFSVSDGIYLSRRGQKSLLYQVNQFMFQTDNYQPCSDGIILQQTFESEGTFNCVSIQARNPLGELNDSIYAVTLEDAAGKQCGFFEVNSSEVSDFTFVQLALEAPLGQGSYRLTIQKTAGTQDMIWLYYDTGHYDAYKKGQLTGFPNGGVMDLAFKVFYGEEDESYFEWYQKEIEKSEMKE